MKPTIGKPAPPFTANIIGAEFTKVTQIKLSDLLGKTVVLYFYPKDATPG